MIVLRCIFISGLLVMSLRAAEPDDLFLNITAKYSYNHIVLVCDIRLTNSRNRFTYLKCPFGSNEICYMNCSPSCNSNECNQIITSCSKKDISNESVQLKYTINVSKINKTGNWYCVHGQKKSNSILVEKQNFPFTSSSTNGPIIISSSTKKSNSIDIATVREVQKIQINQQENQLLESENTSEFWVFITNPNVVLILICVFTASLLFNIIFLIRCALLRTVIDHYIQSNKISDSCLYRCFCIRVSDGLPQVNMKSVPKPNSTNAFPGYHREDVYDDMSASSQAERHLISNYSQYELEQETLLARKFWSADMTQSMLARQSQFYQSQPMSNYVIVSGPVCSNINHGQFITPSSTSFLSNSQRTCITDEMGQPSSHESVCNDSIIYSQPMKNRPKSLGQFSEADVVKMVESGPPAPPIRMCTDTQCYRNSIPHMENLQQSVTMKNVDLIEHCTHPNVINPPQENLS